jgi:hypothetical protein
MNRDIEFTVVTTSGEAFSIVARNTNHLGQLCKEAKLRIKNVYVDKRGVRTWHKLGAKHER